MYVSLFFSFFEKTNYMLYSLTEANVIIEQLMEESNNEEKSYLWLSVYTVFICSSI